MTINVSTAPGDEMIILRHKESKIGIKQGEKILGRLYEILDSMVLNPDQTLAHFDAQDNINTSAPSQQLVHSASIPKSLNPSNDRQVIPLGTEVSPLVLRQVVKECVHEIIGQMFSSGELVRYEIKSQEAANVAARDMDEVSVRTMVEPVTAKEEAQDLLSKALEQRLNVTQDDSKPDNQMIVPQADDMQMTKQVLGDARPSDKILGPLRSLWGSVLDRPEDSIDDEATFFSAGGDSVRAMTLVSIAREAGMPLTVGEVFKYPEILDQARWLEQAMSKPVTTEVTKVVTTKGPNSQEQTEVKVYKKFSLIRIPNIEKFIQHQVCPKINVFRGGVVDVFPTTDFQTLSVAGMFVEARWMLNYFFFDGNGPLNVVRLKKSVQQTIDAYDILRTVFIPYEEKFYQVVLRKINTHLRVFDTDGDLDEYTRDLCEDDRESMSRLGEPYVQFMVVKKNTSNEHRIIIRLSHAQYDGVSLAKIIKGLQSAYEGKAPALSPSFSKYVTDISGTGDDRRYAYWRDLLSGSLMTEILQREQPHVSPSTVPVSQLKRTVNLPSLSSFSITAATIVKAAWAMTLAQMASRTDVVFGHVTSGRNMGLAGVENIVGPCMNLIPVRVTLDKQLTSLDLLRRVQNQLVASMTHESLGFREIIKHCTSWRDWTYFTSIVQHQSTSENISSIRLGDVDYRPSAMGAEDTLADISIVSRSLDGDQPEITQSCLEDEGALRAFAEKALDQLVALATKLASKPYAPLTAPKDITNVAPQTLRAPVPMTEDAHTDLRAFSKRQVYHVSDTLGRAWRAVLGGSAENTEAPDALNLDHTFHELGGDFVAAAQLAAFLEAEGYPGLRAEDLLARPTRAAQIPLLCRRKQQNALQSSSTDTLATSDEDPETIARRGVPRGEEAARPQLRHSHSFWGKSMGLAKRMVVRKSRRTWVD